MAACENEGSHSGGRAALAELVLPATDFEVSEEAGFVDSVWLDQGPVWIGMLEICYIFWFEHWLYNSIFSQRQQDLGRNLISVCLLYITVAKSNYICQSSSYH